MNEQKINWQDGVYPACIGLTYIGYWHRWECWTDLKPRKLPLHLRFLPPKWIWFDRSGAKLSLPWRNKC